MPANLGAAATSLASLSASTGVGMVSAAASMFTTSSGTLPADNSTTVTLTFVARDAYNTPLAGVWPVFTATGTGNTLTTPAATDATGTTTATFKTSVAEAKTVTATVASHTINQSIALTASSANAPDAAHTTIGVAPTSVAVAGTATITVTAKDSSGTAITVGGATVTLSLSGGTATGTIGAVSDNGDGTYTATYTGTGAGTAETINGTINGATITTTLPTITVTGSYQTPDILNNASFENSWGSFVNLSGGTPSGDQLSLSTDQAKDGTYSVKFGFSNTGQDVGAQVAYNLVGQASHLWIRGWFYGTAWPNGGGFKFFRMQDASLSGTVLGIQWLNGHMLLCTPGSSYIYISSGLPSLNAWHSLEYELDFSAHQTRVWLDGTIQTYFSIWSPGSDNPTTDGNGLTSFNTNAGLTFPGYLDICRIINQCTNSGAWYWDRVAVSSLGRIGP